MFVVYLRKTPNIENSTSEVEVKIEYNSDSEQYDDNLDISKFNYSKSESPSCNTEISSYTCELCNENFSEKFELQKHYEIHIGSSSYTCTACSKNFSEELELLYHSCEADTKPIVCNLNDGDPPSKKRRKRVKLSHNLNTKNENRFICKTCNRRFVWEHNLRRHLSLNKCLKFLNCAVCQLSLPNFRKLKEHEKTHPELKNNKDGKKYRRPHVCNVCGKTFRTYYYLKIHIPVHTGERAFVCGACGCRFKAKRTLRMHYRRWHIATRPFSCSLCRKGFMSKKDLVTHTFTHTKKKPFKCKACGKGFCHKKSFIRHAPKCRPHIKHENAEKDMVEDSEGEQMIELSFLNDFDASNLEPIKEETNIKHPDEALQGSALVHVSELDKRYQCNLCRKGFQWKKDLQRHSYAYHAPQMVLVCHPCRKNFQSEAEFESHRCRKRPKRIYICDVCGETYHEQIQFLEHYSLHGDKPFSCDVCHRSFTLPQNLQKHRSVHEEKKNFFCNLCDKSFYVERNLTAHLKVHQREKIRKSGEWQKFRELPKPHMCEKCDKMFAKKTELKKHYMMHINEEAGLHSPIIIQPFNSQLCEQSFASRKNLGAHCKDYGSVAFYFCDICNAGFPTVSALLDHSCHTDKPVLPSISKVYSVDVS